MHYITSDKMFETHINNEHILQITLVIQLISGAHSTIKIIRVKDDCIFSLIKKNKVFK